MSILLIAEKPSLARKLFFLKSKNDVEITSAHGHLCQLNFPERGKFSLDSLPIKDLRVTEITPIRSDKFKTKMLSEIGKHITQAKEIVSVGDPDAEGSLLIYEIFCHFRKASLDFKTGSKGVRLSRMYPLAMDQKSLSKAFNNRCPIEQDHPLIKAALARTWADAIVGFNLTQCVSVTQRSFFSVGRVQTPTLQLIYDREQERAHFQSRTFQTIEGHFTIHGQDNVKGVLINKDAGTSFDEDVDVDELLIGCVDEAFLIESITKEERAEKPPLPPNMNDVLKAAISKLNMSAKSATDTLQALYEKGVISYPRTEVRHLPTAMKSEIGEILHSFIEALNLSEQSFDFDSKRVFNDAKLKGESHFCIYPLRVVEKGELLKPEEQVFNLIRDRFIRAFMHDYRFEFSKFFAKRDGCVFRFSGRVMIEAGFKSFNWSETDESTPLPTVNEGDEAVLASFDVKKGETKPPPAYTQASLLDAMENIWKLYNKDAEEPLKGFSLGRPSTRTAIMNLLIDRGYVNNQLHILDKGQQLIDCLKGDVSIELSANFERKLKGIEAGDMDYQVFTDEIQTFTNQLIDKHKDDKPMIQESTGGLIDFGKGYKKLVDGQELVVWKNSFGANFSLVEAQRLLAGETLASKKLKKKNGEKYEADLKFDFEEGKVVFANEKKKSVVLEEGVIVEQEKLFVTLINGDRHVVWKTAFGSAFSESECRSLLQGESVYKDTLLSKKGKQFSAHILYNIKTKRLDLSF